MAEALKAREAQITARETALTDRMAALSLSEAAIKTRMDEMTSAEASLKKTLQIADGAAEADLTRLTAVYEAMKPADAAKLFSEMAPEFAAGFLGRMNSGGGGCCHVRDGPGKGLFDFCADRRSQCDGTKELESVFLNLALQCCGQEFG